MRGLAITPAQVKLQAALQYVNQEMEKYQQELQYYLDSERTGYDKVAKPAPIDLAKLADLNGLEYGRTGMIDALTAANTDIGKTIFQNQRSFDPPTFAQIMLNPSVGKYIPYSFDSLGLGSSLSTFVTWKVDEKAAYSPTFEQARSEVEAAWKMQKARDLAKARAEELVTLLEEKSGWSQVLNETEQALIIRPTPFTWLQQPSFLSREIRTSIVENIGEVNDEFMESAFKTKIGAMQLHQA